MHFSGAREAWEVFKNTSPAPEKYLYTFPAPEKCLYTLIWRRRGRRSRRSIYIHRLEPPRPPTHKVWGSRPPKHPGLTPMLWSPGRTYYRVCHTVVWHTLDSRVRPRIIVNS